MDWDEQAGEVHTSDCPYCDDPECWCHTDVSYHESVEYPTYTEEEIDQAYSFFGLYH